MDQNVEAAVAVEDFKAQGVDPVSVGQVEWNQGDRLGAEGADLVVQIFKRPLSAAHGDDMGAGRGQGQGGGAADAAGGAGDQGHTAGQGR